MRRPSCCLSRHGHDSPSSLRCVCTSDTNGTVWVGGGTTTCFHGTATI
ncbi:hypothetical protein J2X12_001785 [Pseudarthrobacter oxydans]|uniref:Uncharacterized protein n=1 Tax=Pseudarthrobacter oxydans TaxID=1671 RepID=A0AAW8NA25_PSEOX|nr:hypothetical protein [Pseudarthrobacter oxydans]MDR7163770.1 hypothetical protein [Pseudarthrobacter oxydans]